ncbi:hypothetical protein F2Q69_00012167 [Brassica cretica]|uniref:DUF4283 domain-containing protein n=1 Tax=Brassica cretica TaxID=69181 RepID=A0A8S9R5N5_BRACR|nr:hypothetical protein F2Q69_00012167 [Brassica cretica]
MPEQWGMSEKISACNLGNGRFLFNFDSEEDLNSVFSQGPFHHNFCMFVLVRWEPVIDENYPTMIPFWIQLHGIPLHLCTEHNLKAIGDRLGKLENVDTTDGKIQVGIDSSKPLLFSRKLQKRNKEDITIKLHYEKLFKHCSTCGLMSHENQDCPMKAVESQVTPRETVFDRVSSDNTIGRLPDERQVGSSRIESSRVLRSSHSTRAQRDLTSRDTRYKPYTHARNRPNEGRYAEPNKDQVWKEKQQRPLQINDKGARDSRAYKGSGSGTALVAETSQAVTESSTAREARMSTKTVNDHNVTFRPSSDRAGSQVKQSSVADDLIPPYDALKIDALNEDEQGNEDQIVDAEMHDPIVGNELMLLDEDDLLGDELTEDKSQDEQSLDRTLQGNQTDNSILMIEAKELNEEADKALTRSATRSLVSAGANQRRASPRINAKLSAESVEERKGFELCKIGRGP